MDRMGWKNDKRMFTSLFVCVFCLRAHTGAGVVSPSHLRREREKREKREKREREGREKVEEEKEKKRGIVCVLVAVAGAAQQTGDDRGGRWDCHCGGYETT